MVEYMASVILLEGLDGCKRSEELVVLFTYA
jgi:hypothetical protein